MRLAFGVVGTVPHDVLGQLATALADLGYNDVWSNDAGPDSQGDGIAALAALRAAGSGMRLGLGVAAFDRRPPGALAAAAKAYGVAAEDELLLGTGAGFSGSPLKLMREGIEELRSYLPQSVRIGAAAMGPRMSRLAGEVADFVLLNWMTPDRIRWARHWIEQGAQEAGREPGAIQVAAYVRVAVGKGGSERLAAEANRYAAMPHYGRHFEAMGVEPPTVGVAAPDPSTVAAQLAPYREILDILVVRGIPAEPTLETHLEIARAAV